MTDRSKRTHELITALRNDGYSVAYGADTNDDFPNHVAAARDALDAEELMGYYLVAMAPETTDYYSSTVVEGGTEMAIAQIQMLGAHFRSVLEFTGLETTQLVDAVVDEAITIEETDDGK